MNVTVLVKYVPTGTPQIGDDFRIKREGVEGGLDPGDEVGVEAGLRVAEATGGEVTYVTMGPEPAVAAIRKALSMGGDRGVIVTDDSLRGADALVTARVLAAAIGRNRFDLVIAGVESTDGYTGTMPQALAQFLGVPSLTFARKLDVNDGTIRIERQTATGYDVVEAEAPALVTLTAGANDPRYPTLRGIMGAKQKPVETLTVGDLGLTGNDVKPTQEVIGMEPVPAREAGEVIEDGADAPQRIVEFLKKAKVI